MANIEVNLFLRQFDRFKAHVEAADQSPLLDLRASQFLVVEEGYKRELFEQCRAILKTEEWNENWIGTGQITNRLVALLRLENNLVDWRQRDRIAKELEEGPEEDANEKRSKLEKTFFDLYKGNRDSEVFEEICSAFGARYPVLAYFFFSKDITRFLPTAPTYFDKAIRLLGANHKMAFHCSWTNYCFFLELIEEVKRLLEVQLSTTVDLIDAHSFVWIIANQDLKDEAFADTKQFSKLSQVSKQAIIQARIGQGKFREGVVSHWKVCALTACSDHRLLRASHIKPWRLSSPHECIDSYNGLLLNGSADLAFDEGLISFADTGEILISSQLSYTDRQSLGLLSDMKLTNLHQNHKQYLTFHREKIFKS